MNINKDHWYDGWFYDIIIAPNQDRLFNEIINHIEPNSTVLDVGCGTGRFSFAVAGKCQSVLGIDLSKRNIERANHNLSKTPDEKITFHHTTVNNLLTENNNRFDYAVLTYVIHEMEERHRLNLLYEISQIADKIIIGDYLVPKPNGFWSILNEIVEFAAGSDHYRNYKNYTAKGGLLQIAAQAGLNTIYEIKDKPLTSHLLVLKK